MSSTTQDVSPHSTPSETSSVSLIQRRRSRELFFGVVGPVGAGGSRVISSLKRACEQAGYECEFIKASELIARWAEASDLELPSDARRTLKAVTQFQDLGDLMRRDDASAVARSALKEIAQRRAKATGETYTEGVAVSPDETKRAYMIESIRHPAEVHLLRRIYANAFALIGVVCEDSERERRILGKYFTDPERRENQTKLAVKEFMKRDSDDPTKTYGQHVATAFFEADFFVDNTRDDPEDKKQFLDEPLGRLIRIITHNKIERPTIEETAMHHAHSACVRSACLSRQVGAALLGGDGTIVATGVNEVPRPGGGVYGEDVTQTGTVNDHRCAYRPLNGKKAFCSNTHEQNNIVNELISSLPELSLIQDRKELSNRIRQTRLGQLIEFSRAVHAEMDALLSAGREGVSTVGTRLFVTTFPCHYCARHIVSAGVREVQFIEPYPKSLALELHADAIDTVPATWRPPIERPLQQVPARSEASAEEGTGKVLFQPFVGVAPRLYIKAFQKKRPLKDKITGIIKIIDPEWGDEWAPFTVAYPELEAALTRTR